jgi:nicotinate phosphoribosyltransferase
MRLSPLFNDLYQFTMAEAYFESGKASAHAVFELYFRRCPFEGEYAVAAGFDRVREIVENFRFNKEDLDFLKSLPGFQNASSKFLDHLLHLDLSDLEILGVNEGDLIFGREPILQIRGPVLKAQLLETALLNAMNFATLVATYARRIRLIAGNRKLIEFGMRRAQGPNGAMTAARSSFLGGFDATSNVLAAKIFEIPCVGTMAHSFVQSFWEVQSADLQWGEKNISSMLAEIKKEDGLQTNEGELAAFIAYAKTFSLNSLLLVDTYDTLKSGVPNAIRVFKLLRKFGHEPIGIRLDSGDLVYLSKEARRMLDAAGFRDAMILASNELDENVIDSIQDQGAKVNAYGVGSHLVTASPQPLLGGVYKLVELDGHPRMKVSQQTEKLIIPSAKNLYRLYGKDGQMLLDLMTSKDEPVPKSGNEILALHPSDIFKKAVVTPTDVRPLLKPIFQNGKWLDKISLRESREKSLSQMKLLRDDISRRQNPTPYKVSISPKLRQTIDELFKKECPPVHLH